MERERAPEEVDAHVDHLQAPEDAELTLLEYGSFACRHCRAAHHVITRIRRRFGSRMRYVFRHLPLTSDPWAEPAAILAEKAADAGKYWQAHDLLMTEQVTSQETLLRLAYKLGISARELEAALGEDRYRSRIQRDRESASAASISSTPSFFINGERYTGPWDEASLVEAIDPPMGHVVARTAAQFAGWAPSVGLLLAVCVLAALLGSNLAALGWFPAFWSTPVTLGLGDHSFSMTLQHWINDGVMAVFFLVVGLEIKRELTIGQLADPKRAALPIAAAFGGMLVPAGIYAAFNVGLVTSSGWGIPMATDIAFALGILALLGRRVPITLRVFLTALAIVDDLGAIVVLALFYGHDFELSYALGALLLFAAMLLLNRGGVYAAWPYAVLGVLLWVAVLGSGIHATLAGILAAIAIPTRPPPDIRGLAAQVQAVVEPELDRLSRLESSPHLNRRIVRQLDAIHDRIEAPAHRIERVLEPWSSYVVLPAFALANAGIVFGGLSIGENSNAVVGIGLGLLLGKPLGVLGASIAAQRLGFVSLPSGVSWSQVAGVGFLAGIGFTMSLFIAGQAFVDSPLLGAAKLTIFLASVLSAAAGLILLNSTLPRTSESSRLNDASGPASSN